MKIRNKITAGFLVVALVGWLLGGIGIAASQLLGAKAAEQERLHLSYTDVAHVLESHFHWRHDLLMAVSYDVEFTGSVDSETCALGQWLNSDESDRSDPEVQSLIEQVREPHDFIHTQSAIAKSYMAAGNLDRAQALFRDEILPRTNETIALLAQMEGRYSDLVHESTLEMQRLQSLSSIAIVVLLVLVIAIGVILSRWVVNSVMQPLSTLRDTADTLARGQMTETQTYEVQDEMGQLFAAFAALTDSMREQAEVLGQLAAGDYTVPIAMRSEGDRVNQAIEMMRVKTSEALTHVRDASSYVATSADQMAQASSSLATGSTEQAAAVEQFSAIVQQVETAARHTRDEAEGAMEDSVQGGALMEQSLQDMDEMLKAMTGISESAGEIAKIIKVIDDITFQTNILALNAAVEAARAGQYGSGFAVVAEEVRSLAARSAESAKETGALIEKSIADARHGTELAAKVAEGLRAVSVRARASGVAVGKISEESNAQSKSMEEVTVGIGQIAAVSQQNSATAEQTAAAAEEMSSQAMILDQAVRRFKLGSSSHSAGEHVQAISVASVHDDKY